MRHLLTKEAMNVALGKITQAREVCHVSSLEHRSVYHLRLAVWVNLFKLESIE